MKPQYSRDGIELYLGDCMEILPQLGTVDAVVTDPPYGVNKAEWDNEYPTAWTKEAQSISSRFLVMPGNSALIEAGNSIDNYKDCIVLYNKNGMTRSKISFGNWIPVLAFGDWKWEARPNVLPFVVKLNEKIEHPSPKPLEAITLLVKNYTNPTWKILDPFMGSGTTGIACIRLGRRFIGIEKEPKYFDIAVKRIEKAFEETALLRLAE
jgi:site-specific DNA-methyltransferase (adenine-specific)